MSESPQHLFGTYRKVPRVYELDCSRVSDFKFDRGKDIILEALRGVFPSL